MTARLIYVLLMGLVGAAIVHIAVLILVPSQSRSDVWSRLERADADYRFQRVGAGAGHPDAALVKTPDPLMAVSICRFDLDAGPVHIISSQRVPFWSLSITNRRGQIVYSFNDRNAADGVLDLVVATPLQLVELKKELPVELEASILVEADLATGMAILRGFLPDTSWQPQLNGFLEGARCSAF